MISHSKEEMLNLNYLTHSVEEIIIQNTHESISGAVGKRPVFHRFES